MDHLTAHPLFWAATSATVVLGIVVGVLVFRRSSGRPIELRLLGALAPLAALVSLQILVGFAFLLIRLLHLRLPSSLAPACCGGGMHEQLDRLTDRAVSVDCPPRWP